MQQHACTSNLDEAPDSALYQRHAATIFAYLRLHALSWEDAEDLLLEVFLAALESASLPTLPEAEQLAWLRRVAHHKLVDHFRRAARRSNVPLGQLAEVIAEDEALAPEQAALRQEERRQVRAAVQRLPALQQRVLRLEQRVQALPQRQPQEPLPLREQRAQPKRPGWVPYPALVLHTGQRLPSHIATVAAAIMLVALVGGLTAGLVLVRQHSTLTNGPGCQSAPMPTNPAQLNLYVESGSGPYKLAARDGTVRWHYDDSQIEDNSAPLVADGSVYLDDGQASVYALNAATGALRWHTSLTEGGLSFPVAAACGLVYVYANGDNNKTNVLYALDAATGKVRWHSASTAPLYMVVANGVVYVASYSFPAHSSSLSALNGADGSVLWKAVLPDGEGFFPGGEQSFFSFFPQVVGGVVYAVASVDTATVRVYAYRATDGKLLWRSGTIKNLGAFSSPPAIGTGAIYFGSDNGTVSAISMPAGAPLWHYNAGRSVYASPQVADGLVYISLASNGGAASNHDVIALDAAHGTVRWKQVLHSDIGYASFQFALYAGVLYFSGYADTTVTALNATSGVVLWSSKYAPYHGDGVGPGGLITVAP